MAAYFRMIFTRILHRFSRTLIERILSIFYDKSRKGELDMGLILGIILTIAAAAGLIEYLYQREMRRESREEPGNLCNLMMQTALVSTTRQYQLLKEKLDSRFETDLSRGSDCKEKPDHFERDMAYLFLYKACILFMEESRSLNAFECQERKDWMKKAALLLLKIESPDYPVTLIEEEMANIQVENLKTSQQIILQELRTLCDIKKNRQMALPDYN